MKLMPIIKNCCENEGEHNYRDFCASCAPYWYKIPSCSICANKLKPSGFCSKCKKYHLMKNFNQGN